MPRRCCSPRLWRPVAYRPQRRRKLEYQDTMTSLKVVKGGSIALLRKFASKMLMHGVHGARASGTYALGLCQGNWDDDSQCKSSLYCFQRQANLAVLGCISGETDGSWTGYCTPTRSYYHCNPCSSNESTSTNLVIWKERHTTQTLRQFINIGLPTQPRLNWSAASEHCGLIEQNIHFLKEKVRSLCRYQALWLSVWCSILWSLSMDSRGREGWNTSLPGKLWQIDAYMRTIFV